MNLLKNDKLKKVKLTIKLALRFFRDLISLNFFKFAKKSKNQFIYNHSISISQEIKQGENFENKLFNISLASELINEYEILPNQIFSFWQVIGNPNNKFKKSRTIYNGDKG